MGGAAPEPTSKGGKRPLDAPINLVPYIDMLMTIMTFLMMTAVWTQIAMLEVQNNTGGPQEQQPEPPDDKKPKPIMILLTDRAVKVNEEGGEVKDLPNTGEGFDYAGIKAALKVLKDARPERMEIRIQSEDGVKYSDIVKVIDICTGLEMKQITLTPTGA